MPELHAVKRACSEMPSVETWEGGYCVDDTQVRTFASVFTLGLMESKHIARVLSIFLLSYNSVV